MLESDESGSVPPDKEATPGDNQSKDLPIPLSVKLFVEFIGTFFLCFTITVVGFSETDFAAVAIGSILLVMIYAGGYLSGANFNPAVSLAFVIRGALAPRAAAFYLVAQFAGAFCGGGLGDWITGLEGKDVYPCIDSKWAGTPDVAGFIIEFTWTFALVTVALHTATSKRQEGNQFYGLAIAFTVLAAAVAGGGISGGAFNPAVAVALPVIAGSCHKDVWVYLLAEVLAALSAAGCFLAMTHGLDKVGATAPLSARAAAEFLGSFFLLFQIALGGPNLELGTFDQSLSALAIGSTLMVMVYALGYVSGAHFNPQVSLACVLQGALPLAELPVYWGAQLAGGFAAAWLATAVVDCVKSPSDDEAAIGIGYPVLADSLTGRGKGFATEFLFSFALAYVVLHCATSEQRGNQFFGLAIGFTLVAGAVAGGPVSGGAYNPAVGICLPVVAAAQSHGIDIGYIWVYVVADFLGGAVAAASFLGIDWARNREQRLIPRASEFGPLSDSQIGLTGFGQRGVHCATGRIKRVASSRSLRPSAWVELLCEELPGCGTGL